MPTALIADDDAQARAQLRGALRGDWPELQGLRECANGADAWDAFRALLADRPRGASSTAAMSRAPCGAAPTACRWRCKGMP